VFLPNMVQNIYVVIQARRAGIRGHVRRGSSRRIGCEGEWVTCKVNL
jgi:hypothetical protein